MSISTSKERNELDSYQPIGRTIVYGIQHFLVMAATPISSVFLVASVLELDQGVTLSLLAASLILSGVGSIIQSYGLGPFGPRLPFVMLPGGAPVILFIGIAAQHGARTATGAVILTGLFYFLVLPVFTRLLRFFPALVIGTMITIVGVNLVKVGAQLIFGQPNSPAYGDLTNIGLGMLTILITVLAVLFGTGLVRRIAPDDRPARGHGHRVRRRRRAPGRHRVRRARQPAHAAAVRLPRVQPARRRPAAHLQHRLDGRGHRSGSDQLRGGRPHPGRREGRAAHHPRETRWSRSPAASSACRSW